jgi:hypothetical protein
MENPIEHWLCCQIWEDTEIDTELYKVFKVHHQARITVNRVVLDYCPMENG